MSCVIPTKTEKVKKAINNNTLDYEEMRQRLLETERKLQSLNNLEAEIQSEQKQILSHHVLINRAAEECEDLESVPSAISTVPGSYTGFVRNTMPSSTPSRYEINTSENNKVSMFHDCDLNTTNSSFNQPNFGPKYDVKLLNQNQRLLKEVERLVQDVHLSNQKNAHLVKEMERCKSVAELEDKIVGLMAENQSHDKTLREAERHLDEGQRRNVELQKRLNQAERELVDCKEELRELRLVKTELENQRDEALHNLNEAQDSLEEYQKKTKDKIKRMEEREDELQDSLTSTSQERDDLLDQFSSMEMSLASQEAQIHRLLKDVSSEDARAREVELTNQKLKTQLDLLTAQARDCEKSAHEAKEAKKECDFLRTELDHHRQMAHDVRRMLKLLNKTNSAAVYQDDSGNFSVKSFHMESGAGEGGLLAAELNCNNNGLPGCDGGVCEGAGTSSGLGNMVCEMRNLVTNMDCEIQRLRSDLKQRDADDRTYSNLRDELKVLMDKVERGMCHNQELGIQVSSLERDKKNIMCKLEETLNCVEERDRALQCLETRLNERSTQIVCLQEDIDERNLRINCLEQRLHEMEKRKGDGDKNILDSQPLKEALSRIKELENILQCKNKSMEELQEKLSVTLKELRSVKTDMEKQVECLNIEITDGRQEIDRLKEDGESMRQKLASGHKLLDESRKLCRGKEEKIGCLIDEVDELRYSKDKMEQLLSGQLSECECKIKSCQDKNNELENALVMCQKEVCDHLNKMDEIRSAFEIEVENRDACIRKLKDDLRRTVEELKCKIEDNNSLEHSLSELRNKLQQMCCQLNDAESTIQCLNSKIGEMEKLMLKEKSAWMKESEDLERRLAQACNNLCTAHNEIDILKHNLQEKKNQNDCLQAEKSHLCQELKKACDTATCLQERVKKMEEDNQELCKQLQQKMECIRDLENMIRIKDQELKCLTKFIQELQASKDNSDSVSSMENQIRVLKAQLATLREEKQCKVAMLCECEEAYKHCQILSRDKDDEIHLLKCQIETLNNKLQERAARVDELERGIENLHKDVERRMVRVDEQLKKYETELMDRVQEIVTLKECVKTCEFNMSEKVEEINQQEQKNCLLAGELQSLKLQLKETEDTRDHLLTQLSEKKSEVAELSQQLRINREQMQKQHEDLVQCRQCLSCAQRDADKLRRELDDAISNLEHRECEITRMNEERKCLMDKGAQVSCQLEHETAVLQQQMSEMKQRMEKEMECLRNYSCQLESSNNSLTQKLSLTQRQMMQMEKCFHQKLDNLTRDVEDLNTKLAIRDDEILSNRDCIALKDSEMSRLKRRLCNTEKACTTKCDGSNSNNNSSSDNNGHYVQDYNDFIDVVDDDSRDDDNDLDPASEILESKSTTNLATEWNEEVVKSNKSQNKADNPVGTRLIPDNPKHPSTRNQTAWASSDTSDQDRDSLGVTEVQERLRNNELRQKAIERQLESLEEITQKSLTEDQEEAG